MVKTTQFPMVRNMTWQMLATAAVMLALGQALPAKAQDKPADREFSEAVQQFKDGRLSGAYGRFMTLANRGDVDAARIALHLYAYGSALYDTPWSAAPSELAYWTTLVGNGPAVAAAN